MTDQETVIKGLKMCRVGQCDYRCPYVSFNVGCKNQLLDDAIAMLKEQEADIRQLRLALDIAKGTCKGIVADRR